MYDFQIVREVMDRNDCAGFKTIMITCQETDETSVSKFIMARDFRDPHEKLHLASVEPEDSVQVVVSPDFLGPGIIGEFIAVTSMTGVRCPTCRCGSTLVSDGKDVACPNPDCGLSLMARIERLAGIPFFISEYRQNPVVVKIDGEWHTGVNITDLRYDLEEGRPFSMLMDHRFWNTFKNNLEYVFLEKQRTLSLATFLIEEQFKDFIDSHRTDFNPDWNEVGKFFDSINVTLTHRNIKSREQNLFMYHFIAALGIQSLTPMMIEALLSYEMIHDHVMQPLMCYLVALSSPSILVNEINLHPIQASNVVREFTSRRYEMFDIFSAYCDQGDVTYIFEKNGIMRSGEHFYKTKLKHLIR